jgi:hypothetical protein
MGPQDTAQGPRLNRARFGLATVLIALVALDGWAIDVYLRTHSSLRGSIMALGVCAAVSSIHALWYLRVVSSGRRGWLGGWLGASISYALALAVGIAFLVVAVISTLVSGMT